MNKMEKAYCKKNESRILDQLSKILDVQKTAFKAIGGGFANYIYEYEKDGQAFILRFSLSTYRSFEMIKAEVDFIKYLYDHGVPVAEPRYINSEEMVGVFKVDDQEFSFVSFEKLQGKMGVQLEWDTDLIKNWGKIMGRIHSLSKSYVPRCQGLKRMDWDQDPLIKEESLFVPNYESIVIEKLKVIKEKLNKLPKTKEDYGLIHGDFTPINFLVDGKDIFVYDFDDCEYNWYIMDVAKALFYAMWRSPQRRLVKDNLGFSKFFLEHFMAGYSSENTLSKFWLDQIPLFLKLYEIYMYKLSHQEFDVYNLRPEVIEFFKRYKYNIENDIPYIESAFFPWG